MSNSKSGLRPWALYLGLGASSASMLLLQQFLTRVFSVLYNSGLAFLAISITFLGLGSAGVVAAVFPRLFRTERLGRLIPPLALAYALLLTASVIAMVAIDERMAVAAGENALGLSAQVQRVVAASALLLPPMFTVGLVISLVLKAHVARVGRLYGADLLGGGLGCLLVLPLMCRIGGDDGVFAIGALAAFGAACFGHAHRARGWTGLAGVVMVALLFGPLANSGGALVAITPHRTPLDEVSRWVDVEHELHHEWNELSRIGIYPTRGEESLYIQIDSSCQTTAPSQSETWRRVLLEKLPFENLPYVLDKHGSYLEIGAGGGRGMLIASLHGTERITGVEINPTIVATTLGDGYPGFGIAPLVADPAHRLVLDEGRSYVRGSEQRYDTLTITYIQTMVASGSAAFALSEANLFTVEAFVEYLRHLEDDGIFFIYRHGGNEMLRLLSIAREALQELGITDVAAHLFVFQDDNNRAMLMIGRSPFTLAEMQALEGACAQSGLQVRYSPSGVGGDLPPNPLFVETIALRENGALTLAKGAELYERYRNHDDYQTIERTYLLADDWRRLADGNLVDIGATWDDRPYYFFRALNHLTDFPMYLDLENGRAMLGGTVILLFWMTVLFVILVAALIALPLCFGRLRQSGRGLGLPVLAYFSALGLGYMAVQLSFIQRFVLFLGHPVYAISVVLLGFLVWTGLGAMVSDRVFARRGVGFGTALLALTATLLVANQVLPAIFASSLIGLPAAVKIVISVLLIGPLAFQMGFFFPRGIRCIEHAAPDLVPWAWGANSAASVLGSILALITAIHGGFALTTTLGAAIYLLVAWPAGRVLARRAG